MAQTDVNAPVEVERPWYIGLLLGVAGWFAGLFLLIFMGAVLRPDSAGGALTSGIVLLAAAWGLFKVDRDGVFVSQMALAISIAGQCLLLFGLYQLLFKSRETLTGAAFVALLVQAALVVVMPNRLHRTMSTLFACIAWAVFIRFVLWDEPRWLHPGNVAKAVPSLMMVLAGWLVAWVPAALMLYGLVVAKRWRPIASGLILGLSVATLISYPIDAFSFFEGIHPAGSWLAIWPVLSALASLGALAAAFALGSRGLMGIAIAAALLHVSHFYYQMDISLLAKSLIMIVLGVALIVAARSVRKLQ